MNNPLFTTRRDFLRTTLLGGALSWTVPSFVAQTFSALHAEADGSLTQVATGKDGPILVLIQLAGGNDGLNAVVPYTNDFYYQARPTIGIPANQVLTLNDTLGLNPAMAGFKNLFDAGHLSVVNGVGYPNPNRSHFRATEIWQTASDEDKYLTDGWLGRYFDNACQGCDPTVGINIGPRLPQAFSSHTPTGISLENPDSYRFMGAGQNDDETLAYRSMYTPNPDENVFDSAIKLRRQRQHGLRHGHAAKRPERARFSRTHVDGCAGQLGQNPRHRRAKPRALPTIPAAASPIICSSSRASSPAVCPRASSTFRRAATTPTPASAAARMRGSRNWAMRSRPSPTTSPPWASSTA